MKQGLLLWLVILSAQSSAIEMASYYIPGLVIDQDKGLFVKLHREIFKRLQQPADFKLLPARRVQLSFQRGELDSYFPELWENVAQPKSDYVVSDSFWYKKVILYARKDSDIRELSDVYHKTAGAVRGYSYGDDIIHDERFTILYNHNDDMNVKMLLKGRIDAIFGDNASTLNAVKNNIEGDLIYYDLNKPIAVLDVFYICHNNPEGVALCAAISDVIQQLKKEDVIVLDRTSGESEIRLP